MTFLIEADWPAPSQIHACTTLRHQGCSASPYESWNLAKHVADKESDVMRNRQLLKQRLDLPEEPIWLEQVHGVKVLNVDVEQGADLKADGSFSTRKNRVCCVMTADCLPVLITNTRGTEVAAVHAGWRGLAAGVIEAGLARFTSPADELLVWLGPAIGPDAFEVGEEVRQAFMLRDPNAEKAFRPSEKGTLLANLYQLARQRLQLAGVSAIYGGNFCTYTEEERFYSFRRNPETGRMASLIWMQS